MLNPAKMFGKCASSERTKPHPGTFKRRGGIFWDHGGVGSSRGKNPCIVPIFISVLFLFFI